MSGRDPVVELGVDGPQDTAVGQFRDELVDGLLEAQEALFDQRHCGRGGDGLGERGDPEDGVAREGVSSTKDGVPMGSMCTLSSQATRVTSPGRRPAATWAAIESCRRAKPCLGSWLVEDWSLVRDRLQVGAAGTTAARRSKSSTIHR